MLVEIRFIHARGVRRVIAFRCGEEAGLSRIYAGQHFRTDHNAGKLLGQQVAESVIDTVASALRGTNGIRRGNAPEGQRR